MIDILSSALCGIGFGLLAMLGLTCVTIIGCVVVEMAKELYDNRKE